tara:strand:- start:110 stop:430 length:321 start_codon:yes stop_codon:yes gene_type:complete
MKEKLPNTNAVIALGIVSICTCFMYGFISLACGIIGLVLAKKSIKLFEENPDLYDESSYNTIKAGKTCSIIGISLSAAVLLIFILFFGAYLTMFFTLISGVLSSAG